MVHANNPGNQPALTIATTHTQARYVLVSAIMAFRQRFPRVRLNILQIDADQVAKRVASGLADVGIANEALGLHPHLDTWEMYRWTHILVVPHGHPLTRIATLTLQDIHAHPLILTEQGIAGRGAIDTAFTAAGLTPDVTFVARDTDVIKTYVEAGLGVGIIPGIAYEVTKDYGLVTLAAGHLFGEQLARLAVRKGGYVRLHAGEFIKFLLPGFRPDYAVGAGL